MMDKPIESFNKCNCITQTQGTHSMHTVLEPENTGMYGTEQQKPGFMSAVVFIFSSSSRLGYGPNQVIAIKTQKTLENASLKRENYKKLG